MTKEEKREYDRNRYIKKKESIIRATKEYRINHPEVSRKAQRKYYWKNRDKVLSIKRKNDKTEEQRAKNRQYYYDNRISKIMSKRIRDCINKNGKSWISFVDYTVEELKNHLESQFDEKMNWKNYGKNGWEIDHIKPVSSFNITSFDCDDFKECWSLDNLQPLWGIDNRRKYNKEIYNG